MQKINYNDIDFSKLKRLDVDSFESEIYIDDEKEKIYKIFKTSDMYELSCKSFKLDLLEMKNKKKIMSVPNTKIISGHFCGTIEDYIAGIDLSDIFTKYDDMNDVLSILMNASIALEDIHKEKIIVSDLNSGNIRVDTDGEVHYLDTLSYKVDKLENNTISGLLGTYLIKRNIHSKKITKEMDKISFMLMLYTIIFQKTLYDISVLDYENMTGKIKYLDVLWELFLKLESSKKIIDIPYLHEMIDVTDIKKYGKEMR